MKRSLGLASLLCLGVLAISSESRAADWYRGPSVHRYAGAPVSASTAFLADPSTGLHLANVELAHDTTLPLRALRTVRFGQQYAGLPVIGKGAVVRVGADGTVRAAVVDVARNLSVATIPAVDSDTAVRIAESVLGRALPEAGASLAVLPQEDKGGVLVWQVHAAVSRGLYQVVIDAQTGGLLYHHPLWMDALGRVYAINPVQTPNPEDLELPTLVPSSPQHLNGFGGNMAVYGYVSGDVTSNFMTAQNTEPNSGDDFLYGPNPDVESLDDPFAEVNAFYHCGRMDEYFTQKHGLDMTGSKWSLSIVTSYAPASDPSYIDNAFYTPGGYGVTVPGARKNLIAIGRGTAVDFAYDSDVFLHEYTHYVNHNAVAFSNGAFDFDQYGIVVMPGAIDEGTADYFSSTINNDPVVGEATLGPYARDLSGSSGHCPDTVFGESHEDGKLIGTAAWAVRKALGTEVGDQVVWGAVTMLGHNPSLGDFGRGLLQTASDLGLDAAQVAQIQDILHERGLDDCDRVLELHEGQSRTTTMFGLDIIGEMMGATCAQMKNYGLNLSSIFHFKHVPADGDKGVKLTVHLEDRMGSGALNWSIYARKGGMVTFAGGSQYQPPDPSVYDYLVSNNTSHDGEMVIDDSSDPPFDPGSEYYFVIVHQNCPVEGATVQSASIRDVPVDGGLDVQEPESGSDGGVEPDAQVEVDAAADAATGNDDAGGAPPAANGADDDDGGCGCSTPVSGRGAGAGVVLAVALAFGAARRRRSRR